MSTRQRRWQPLLEQWVIISAASSDRPWSGAVTAPAKGDKPRHDPECYLCPGVTRASGHVNPDYQKPWAFDNDFASLGNTQNSSNGTNTDDVLGLSATAGGVCRVMCWSERHDATLADLSEQEIIAVAHLWKAEYESLSARPSIKNVLIFENKGIETGVSNLHPHGQIYATDFVTDSACRMRSAQSDYRAAHKQSLLQALIKRPEYQADLLVERGDYFVTIVPFAARFSYESWIVPTRHVGSLADMAPDELTELAFMYQRQAQRYDTIFQRSCPNVTLLHNVPCDGDRANDDWCFHLAMQPPLRDLNKVKFLAGFESGSGNIINPVQPEAAAQQMRSCNGDMNTSGLLQ